MTGQDDILRDMILGLVPSDGSNISNQALLTVLQDRATRHIQGSLPGGAGCAGG